MPSPLRRSLVHFQARSAPARHAAAVLIAAAALAGTGVAAHAQAPPPDGAWLTFRTEHFRVTYSPGLEDAAVRAAVVAERTHALLREELAPAPQGPIELVVTDHVDFTNGYATPFTTNRVVVFARPPVDIPQLAYSRDWIELVVAHEIVHIFHMDVAGRFGRAVRVMLGRVPMVWPIFPVVGTPTWSLEGLATHYESRLTGGGRVHGSFHDMVVRMAALETRIPDLDELSTPNPLWPGGQRSYVYGSLFMRWIADTYGPEAHERIIEATAGSWRPTFFLFDHVAREATGSGFRALYREWRPVATSAAEQLRDRLAADGLTVAETVVEGATYTLAPRFSPDGTRVSFGSHDLRSDPATRVLDVESGRIRTIARRNQFGSSLGTAAWIPDGSAVITAELDYRGPYRLYSDLWRTDVSGGESGSQSRITRGARVSQPDVSPDGRTAVAIRNADGSLDLVTVDLGSGVVAPLVEVGSGEAFGRPRWSPDGRSIAASLYRNGRVDLVRVDVASGALTAFTNDDALDGAPVWSPDGRWIIWWSDRTGIPNLFAVDAAGQGAVHQVTSVLGGAFDPEVSPDGQWVYFSGYHAGGWRIERLPFDPAAWRSAPSSTLEYGAGAIVAPTAIAAGTAGAAPDRGATGAIGDARAAVADARPYSALPSVLPRFWLPAFRTTASDSEDTQHLRLLGVQTFGWDVLGRHNWEASFLVDPWSGRLAGDARWTYAGLGQPALTASTGRAWSRIGVLDAPAGREAVYLREDNAALEASLRRSRWRSSGVVALGADITAPAYELHALDREVLANPDPPKRVGLVARSGYSNARTHPLSISREDGIAATFAARRWWALDGLERDYDQLQGRLAAYRGFALTGFANHVAAARISGAARFGPGALPTGVGGVAGGGPDLGFTGLGGTALFLPVRGFDESVISGTRAWTGSAEYRAPIHLFGYRSPILGLSLTAVSGAVFADFGDAWCTPAQAEAIPFGCQHVRTAALAAPSLMSAGAEISVDAGLFHDAPIRFRGGVALPIRGPARSSENPLSPHNWQVYFRFGPSF